MMASTTIHFEGRHVTFREGDTLAAALLRAGVKIFSRGVKYHRPRGPFCLSGSCGQCLVRVDGQPSRMACAEPARAGAVVERQNALPSAEHDLLRAADWTFRDGFDHHHFMTFWRPANDAMQTVARRVAGIGNLPDLPLPPAPAPALEYWDVVVVGAGPAGLAAGATAARAGARTLVVDEAPRPGGRLRAGIAPGPDARWIEERAAEIGRAGSVRLSARALGAWMESAGPRLLLEQDGRLVPVAFAALVAAPGGAAQNLVFGNNDLPGVFAARGLAILIREHGVAPGRRAVVVAGDQAGATTGEEAEPRLASEAAGVAALLRAAGVDVLAPPAGARLLTALGRRAVEATLWERAGRAERLECDLVAVCSLPQPLHELCAALGAQTRWDPAAQRTLLSADGDGRTAAPGVFACGEVTGPCAPDEAAEAGARVGSTAAEHAGARRAAALERR